MSGPFSVPYLVDWAIKQFESKALNVTVGSAQFDLFGENGSRILLEDSLIRVKGRTAATVLLPRAEIGINLSGLLTGDLEITSVALERPSATIKLASGSEPLPRVQNRVVAIDKFSVIAVEELKRWHLEKVAIEYGRLVINAQGEEFVADGIDANAVLLDDLSFAVNAKIVGREGDWSWDLKRTVTPETGARNISVNLRDASLRDLLPTHSFARDDKLANTRLFVEANAELWATGEFVGADMNVRTSPIFIRTAPDNSITVDEAFLDLNLQRDNPDIIIGRSYLRRKNTRVVFGGVVQPPVTEGAEWNYSLGSREIVLAPADVKSPPLLFPDAYASGTFDPTNSLISIERARAVGLDADINVAGSFYYGKPGPSLALSVYSPSLSFGEVLQVWPTVTAPKTRNWLIDHLGPGRVDNIALDLALGPEAFDGDRSTPAWQGDGLTASFDVIDGSVKALKTLPVVRDLTGTGKIENEDFSISGSNGHFRMQDGNIVKVPEVQFAIKNIATPGALPAELSVLLTGRADDLGVLADAEPINALESFSVVPADLSGMGEVRVEALFPLLKNLKVKDVEWRANLDLKDFSSKAKISGQTIENANLIVQADTKQTQISGKGKLNGFQSEIDLSTSRDGSGAEDRQGVTFVANAKDLTDYGVDLQGYVKGSVKVSYEDSGGAQVFELDLSKAAINVREVGWSKVSGVRATARFRVTKNGNARTLHNFSFLSEGVEVRGNLKIDGNGKLALADFSAFNLRPNDKAKMTIRPRRGGGYQVVMNADRFDGRALLDSFGADNAAASAKRKRDVIAVDLTFRRLIGFRGVQAQNVRIDGLFRGVSAVNLAVSGATSSRGQFNFTVGGEGKHRFAKGKLNNAGEFLRFMDLFPRMRGGNGRLDIQMPTDTNWAGQLTVNDFSITEDPAIKALKGIEPKEIRGTRNSEVYSAAVNSGEASFQKMRMQFSRRGDILNVSKGTLSGAIIGGTFSGNANLKNRQLDMAGTFVPAYALNNLFAKLPVIGLILGGGSSDEGLFGVTYKLDGTFEKPKFQVNPVSAIAPGVFRRIFEFK
ncbi:AsmA-like C-terminal domain-containing protein [Pseudovibrio sp. Alg231-02]|uniref:AsmA-like C-terminal domain-containing protein n=1 Tax=Pseudovibrio sp. Alg231-02 TaxID=1922223 RepID=UPI001AD91CFF|nr:AsmA-like C-terminal domain-containing protein [Pseudovibrio sp. Alg231-02]